MTAESPVQIPAYDTVCYVNNILAENTQLLTASSAYFGDESYTYGAQRLYADSTDGSTQTYLYDGRGSVIQLLEKLAVVGTLCYTDYGVPTVAAPAAGGSSAAFDPFYGYNGEEHDPLTGLQYLRARYYAPQTGSFITGDTYPGTLEDPLSQNAYTYAQNDPVNHADPSGHMLGGLGSRTVLIADGMRGSSAQAVAQKAASTAKKAPAAGYKSASPIPASSAGTQKKAASAAVKTPTAAAVKTPVSPTVNAKTAAAKVRAQSAVPPAKPQSKARTTYANAGASNLPSLAPVCFINSERSYLRARCYAPQPSVTPAGRAGHDIS